MIRRDGLTAAGEPGWRLISQIDHARLAGALAAAWRPSEAAPFEPREPLLSAITNHDDGWSRWEERPAVDPAQGRPLNFTEMPLAESIKIWTRSIDAAELRGPLEAHVTSAHFAALLSHANRWQLDEHPVRAGAESFLADEAVRREEWLRRIEPVGGASPEAIAERGLRWLQFFDNMSLWLCCAERHGTHVLNPPDGTPLTLKAEAGGVVRVSPWPMILPSLGVSVPAREIPAVFYVSAEVLATVTGRIFDLVWRLIPGESQAFDS